MGYLFTRVVSRCSNLGAVNFCQVFAHVYLPTQLILVTNCPLMAVPNAVSYAVKVTAFRNFRRVYDLVRTGTFTVVGVPVTVLI